MPLPQVVIKISAEGETTLIVDHIVIDGIGGVEISSVPGSAPKVLIEIVPSELTVEAEGILTPHILRAARQSARSHSSEQ